ncbi:trimeric intracellular cation channel family protein [Erythrobacter sp.]|uniref:trimeric intracellular cation channel family protein n=1 Tax=Erythrobacter sp. TaxID=1042 RepID=UPI001425FD6C|nr:trimeric intracellular cation channel family protein [Erythrobacter sp.]QIQ85780.1 MAG: trimeric intracellular cation channel family protein [Erythrobacter sp.]
MNAGVTGAILTPILDWLDLAGIAVFALSGALIAARERQSFVTMGFFALVTGVGGGTIRDLLIGAPVFWIFDPWVAPVCLGMAILAWYFPGRIWDGRLFFYADGAGLAAFSVLGTAKALAYGIPPVPAMLMGVLTGVAGGIIRDVVAGRPSVIMQPQIYLTAALIASAITAAGSFLAEVLRFNETIAWAAAFAVGFVVRLGAIRFRWRWPSYGRLRRKAAAETAAQMDAIAEIEAGEYPAGEASEGAGQAEEAASPERDSAAP